MVAVYCCKNTHHGIFNKEKTHGIKYPCVSNIERNDCCGSAARDHLRPFKKFTNTHMSI